MKNISVLCVDIRSTHNIGSIFRTSDGMGVDEIILCGVCPRPFTQDDRLPHIAIASDKAIKKTALGAEKSVPWVYFTTFKEAISYVKAKNYKVLAIEQSKDSQLLQKYASTDDCCLVFGREVEGLSAVELEMCNEIIEIPMHGTKESLNVSNAAAIALYHMRYLC